MYIKKQIDNYLKRTMLIYTTLSISVYGLAMRVYTMLSCMGIDL